WPTPFQPPHDWSNVIHFWTGAAFILISQDPSRTESRGHNFDGGMGDEIAQCEPNRYFNECLAATRTNRKEFQGVRLYRCERLATSTPMTREGQWVFKYQEDARDHPDQVLFIRANALMNAKNLAPDWFEKMLRKAISKMHFDAEILNIRPNLVVQGYYPALRRGHLYSANDPDFHLSRIIDGKSYMHGAAQDLDYDPKRPLILTIVPGAAINAAVTMQMFREKQELRCLHDWWCKYPS